MVGTRAVEHTDTPTLSEHDPCGTVPDRHQYDCLQNSAVFKTIGANRYTSAVVSPLFLKRPDSYDSLDAIGISEFSQTDRADELLRMQSWFMDNSKEVRNLSNSDCISTYGNSFVSEHSHVLLLTHSRGDTGNQSLFWAPWVYEGLDNEYLRYDWICLDEVGHKPGQCDIANARKNADTWSIADKKIKYCLARQESL